MFSRNLIPIWFGIIILSGLFLMGQDAWPPLPAPCQDGDGDYYGRYGADTCPFPGIIDCDDTDPDINPGVEELAELCTNDADDDCDTLVDGDDEDCGVTGMVPDTGIINCYDDGTVGVMSECPADAEPFYGQDAQYETNPMGYTDNGDGTVTDHVTGLRWQQCTAGLSGAECEGDPSQPSWYQAQDYCDTLTLGVGNFDDWRLPEINELQSIIDYGEYFPAINPAYFPGTPYNYYWSMTEDSGNTSQAWRIFSQDGFQATISKGMSGVTRCVRRELVPRTFTDQEDGTIIDNLSGLVWQKGDSDSVLNWEDALNHCETLTLATFTDWRLPDIKELVSTADYWTTPRPTSGCYGINAAFECSGGAQRYMSSSTKTENEPAIVWHLLKSNGQTIRDQDKTSTVYVRCVR